MLNVVITFWLVIFVAKCCNNILFGKFIGESFKFSGWLVFLRCLIIFYKPNKEYVECDCGMFYSFLHICHSFYRSLFPDTTTAKITDSMDDMNIEVGNLTDVPVFVTRYEFLKQFVKVQ